MVKQKRLIDLRRGEFFAEDRLRGVRLDWNHPAFIREPDERELPSKSENIPVDYDEGRFAFYLGVREKLLELTGDIDYADDIARRCMVNSDTFRGFAWGLVERGLINGLFHEKDMDKKLVERMFDDYKRTWNPEPYQWKVQRLETGRNLAHQLKVG